MTNQEFYHWVNGYFILNATPLLTPREVIIIKNHLNLAKEVEGFLSKENAQLAQLMASYHPDAAEEITQKVRQIYVVTGSLFSTGE